MPLDKPGTPAAATQVLGLIAQKPMFFENPNSDLDVEITFPANLGDPTSLLEGIVRNPTLGANGRHFDFHLTSSVAIQEVKKFSERTIGKEQSLKDYLEIQLVALGQGLREIQGRGIKNNDDREMLIARLAIVYGLLRNPYTYFANSLHQVLYDRKLDAIENLQLRSVITGMSQSHIHVIAETYKALKLVQNFRPGISTSTLENNLSISLSSVIVMVEGVVFQGVYLGVENLEALDRLMRVVGYRQNFLLPNP